MIPLSQLIPEPPEWRYIWDNLMEVFPALQALSACPQEPAYHGEGDVGIHTRLVCESITQSQTWQSLASNDRRTPFIAALLHDIGKPAKTRFENGRITSRGHSHKGEVMARIALWEMGLPIAEREQIASLIRYHQVPFFLVDRPDSERALFELSQSARCDYLALVAMADAQGRICEDKQRLIDNIYLFSEYASERGCLISPRQFPSDHSRFEYFRSQTRSPKYLAHDSTRLEVVLMSGLPGAGKDYWISANLSGWPVVSLDDLRQEMKIRADRPQGAIVSKARELAREYLRAGQSFVWNATNLSRQIREACISLFAAYNAGVRIVYVESSAAKLFERNRQRRNMVPEQVLHRLLERWEVPDLTEAHQVEWVLAD